MAPPRSTFTVSEVEQVAPQGSNGEDGKQLLIDLSRPHKNFVQSQG